VTYWRPDGVVHRTYPPGSSKLGALLRIAAGVQRSGRDVRAADVEAARDAGATDLEIHDTVLIAAAFCLFNRYVDGLATTLPEDPGGYAAMAELIVSTGYAATAGQPSSQSL